MGIIRRITHRPAARVAWRVLAFAACLSALLPASSAQAQANEIVTKQLTVVTVPVHRQANRIRAAWKRS